MFMAKNELSNAVTLARVQIKNNKLSLIGLGIVLLIILLAGLIPAIVVALSSYEEHIAHSTIFDNFFIPVLGISFGVTVLNFIYRSYNKDYAVYPQTNNSRFLANQIYIYSMAILIPLAVMFIYLIQYGVMAVIAHGRDNVHLVFDFSIAFVLSGLVVAIIYVALIAGTITLISALIRKFRLYAIVFFTVLTIVLLVSITEPSHLLLRLLGFLLDEPNIWLFILKGIGTWAVLFITAFLVNRYTVYYKSHSFKLNSKVVGGLCATMIFATYIIISLVGMNVQPVAHSVEISEEPSAWDVLWDEHTNVLEIDLSDVPPGSDINVVASGSATFIDGLNPEIEFISTFSHHQGHGQTTFHFADGTEQTFPFGHLVVLGGDELRDIDGNTLFAQYHYPIQVIQSGGLISHLMNPQFDIRFEGNTLYVNYTYDRNQKAIVIPVWSFMSQFDNFRGQNVFNESLIWQTWVNVNLWLWVE
ncbi:MAG: hypothetical protein FWC13_13390 [Oscillospiraceae bacterium]|nr:hypothetical protein [Oscillospiraceae bacterium]